MAEQLLVRQQSMLTGPQQTTMSQRPAEAPPQSLAWVPSSVEGKMTVWKGTLSLPMN